MNAIFQLKLPGLCAKLTLAVLLAFVVSINLSAQSGLRINSLFGGTYKNRKDAVETYMKGKVLKPYKLTLFRSISIKPRGNEAAAIEQKVKVDTRHALDRESGMKGGHLYYGFYRLQPRGRTNRYIFYRNNTLRKGAEPTLTLIYMEGQATLEQLKSTFAKH